MVQAFSLERFIRFGSSKIFHKTEVSINPVKGRNFVYIAMEPWVSKKNFISLTILKLETRFES